MASNIGMMDSAYFVGRTELLRWINTTLDLNLSKVEQCASGTVACQLMDALHPGMVALGKVNFEAKNEYEYIANYKVLQASFDKLNITKHIEVNKLIKARALDNLEFMQWFKAYYDSMVGSGRSRTDYDPASRRAEVGAKGSMSPYNSGTSASKSSSGGAAAKRGGGGGGGEGQPQQSGSRPTSARPSSARPASRGGASGAPASSSAAGSTSVSNGSSRTTSRPVSGRATPANPLPNPQQEQEIEALTKELAQVKLSVDGIEKERDFYFSKLRDIEILCQMAEFKDMAVVKAIIRILYASTEDIDVLDIAQNASNAQNANGESTVVLSGDTQEVYLDG